MSGTRLKAVWRVGEDGTRDRVLGTWFDTERQAECNFRPAGDGVTRCLPSPNASASTHFSQESCGPETRLFQQPVAACLSGEDDLGAITDALACPTRTRLFRLRAVSLTRVWTGSPPCGEIDAPVGYSLFEAIEELDPKSFVSAEIQHD